MKKGEWLLLQDLVFGILHVIIVGFRISAIFAGDTDVFAVLINKKLR